jgi:hypothetical protein
VLYIGQTVRKNKLQTYKTSVVGQPAVFSNKAKAAWQYRLPSKHNQQKTHRKATVRF